MGKADAITKNYLKNNVVFSDAVNYLLHDGKQVISPDSLRELDPVRDTVFGKRTIQRIEDVVKGCLAKEDDDAVYLIISLENQTQTDLTMPVRIMLSDAIAYMDQIRQIRANHETLEAQGQFLWKDSVERLSGISYTDRLKPVITFVIHWEGTPWSGPRRLHELLDFEQDWVKTWVPDWPLFLIDAANIGEAQRQKFSSDLGNVLHLIQRSTDKKQLKTFCEENLPSMHLGTDGRRVVSTLTGIKFEKKEGTEVTAAVKEWIDEVREEGHQAGLAEGQAQGRTEGMAQGREEGRAEGRDEAIQLLFKRTGWSPEEFMDTLKIPAEEREQYRKILK